MDFVGDIEAALPGLRRYAQALVGDRDIADDLVHSCLDTALTRRIQRHRDGPVRACLYRILVNRYRDLLRRSPSRPVAVGGTEGVPFQLTALDDLQEALGRLPADQRAALLLVALEALTPDEAAQVLSLKRAALLSCLAKARAALRLMTRHTAAPEPAAEHPVPEESLLRFHGGGLAEPDRSTLAARIEADPGARATLTEWERQDRAIATLYAPLAGEPLPPRFRDRLDNPGAVPPRRPLTLPRIGAMAAALATLAIGLGTGWGAHAWLRDGAGDPALATARAFRAYVVDSAYELQVPASDAGTLATWLTNRLHRPVAPPDLSYAGYRLDGGRALPTDTSAAALFLYEDANRDRLVVYVAAGNTGASSPPRFFDTDGTRGYWWLGHGLSYALAGTPPDDTLRYLTTLAYTQMH